MKTFLRKLKLSFLAMLCGWIACNIAWWLGALPTSTSSMPIAIREIIAVAVYTAIVVLMAWLAVFLPVDLCVGDNSRLRKPSTAALCGFLSAFAIVAVVFGYIAWFEIIQHGFLEGVWRTLDKSALPYALGTCATGTVAALVRACMNKQQPRIKP
ncbi:MAG: hypothetical protein NTY98_17815 [Verrucomicrobia bacterium]|nr:hypothetical protein [Verrucomicrobiota bacterium]